MASTPNETLLEGKGFSCEARGNGPEEKDKELDVLHLKHVAYTPAPPGPKREGTDPSVHTWISDGGREDSLLEAIWSRVVLLPVQSGMKGENSEVGCAPWWKRGARDQRLTWGWEWLCG